MINSTLIFSARLGKWRVVEGNHTVVSEPGDAILTEDGIIKVRVPNYAPLPYFPLEARKSAFKLILDSEYIPMPPLHLLFTAVDMNEADFVQWAVDGLAPVYPEIDFSDAQELLSLNALMSLADERWLAAELITFYWLQSQGGVV